MGIPATEHDIFYADISRFRRDPHGVPRKVKAMQRQEASEMLGGYLLEEHRHRPALGVRRNKELDKSPCVRLWTRHSWQFLTKICNRNQTNITPNSSKSMDSIYLATKKTTLPWSAMYHVLKIGHIPKKCYLMIGKRMTNYGIRLFLVFHQLLATVTRRTGDYPVEPPLQPCRNTAPCHAKSAPSRAAPNSAAVHLAVDEPGIRKGNLGGIAHRIPSFIPCGSLGFMVQIVRCFTAGILMDV